MNIIKLNTIGETTKKGTSGGEGGLQIKSVDITENGSKAITPDAEYSGMSKVIVNTDVNTLGGLDFEGVFDQEQADEINQHYKDGIEYAKEIKRNWDENVDTLSSKFTSDTRLVYMPKVNFPKKVYGNGCFLYCVRLQKVISDEPLQWYSFSYSFQYCGSLLKIPTLDFSLISNACVSMCQNATALKEVKIINSSNLTSLSQTFTNTFSLKKIEFDSIESLTTTSSPFGNALSLESVCLPKWKQTNLSFVNSSKLSAESIHNLIQTAVNMVDGATTRTLSLHATAKTNWMNSEYYEEDEITRITKGIEIS